MSAEVKSHSTRQLRGSSVLLVGRFIAIGSNLLIQVLIVRYLSQTAYGALAYGIALANLLMVVVSLGMDQTVSRFAAVYDEQKAPEKLLGTLTLYLGVTLALGSLAVAGVFAGRPLIDSYLVHDHTTTALLGVMVLLAPLQALDTLMINLFAVYARPMSIFWRRYVIAPALRIAAVAIVLVTKGDVFTLAWGYVAAVVLGLAIYTLPLVNLLREHGLIGQGIRPVIPVKTLLKFTAGAISADLLVIVLFASDVVIVGALRGPVDVALLQAAQPLANGNLVIFYAMIPLFIPMASRLFSAGELGEASALYSRCTLWIAVFTFPVMAMTVCFAQPVTIAFFGDRYAEAGWVLAALALGQYILASFGLTTLTLKAHGKLFKLAIANALVAVFNIGLNIVLVKAYGPLGAAVGTLLAITVLTVVKTILMRTELGLWPADRLVVRGLASVAVTGAVLLAAQVALQPNIWLAFALAALGSLAVLLANRRVSVSPRSFPRWPRFHW